jgi:hypothetical protein
MGDLRPRRWIMALRAGSAACLCLAIATPGRAADLGVAGGPAPPYGSAPLSPVVIVVPACEEQRPAVLMRCLPRREIAFPRDIDLIRIERSMSPSPTRPYKQLFTWP